MSIVSSTTAGIHCPECQYPGAGVHWAHCSKLTQQPTWPAILTEADVRRIVREELERASFKSPDQPKVVAP